MTDQPIHVIDLQAQRRHLASKIEAGIAGVMQHGRFVLGPEVEELERRLDAWTGAKTVCCANGTDALLLGLWALGVGVGDAVITPSFSFAATAGMVVRMGATPIFVDVEEGTYNISLASLEKGVALARRSGLRLKGIIAVDLFGLPPDYAAMGKLAAREGIFLMADSAQSFGGRRGNEAVGSLAEITSTSFYPTKPLACYGDGGAVFARDPKLAEKVRILARHGETGGKYNHAMVGMNSRLDSMQAAILLVKLDVLAEELTRREVLATRYDAALKGKLPIPSRVSGAQSAWAHYTVRVKDRPRFIEALAKEGVMTAVHYPKPLHHQPAFMSFPTVPGGCPISERLAAEVVSLPLHPYLSDAQQDKVIGVVLKNI